MLYQAGSITTKEKTSPTGVSMWQKELGVGHSEFRLETGYNMFRKSSAGPDPVIFGEYHPTNKTTYMDLADFNTNGTAKFMDASRSYIDVPSRAFNLARVLEHEYFGHGIMKLRDDIVKGGTQAGNNEDKLSNPIRKELGLPLRMNYSIRAKDYQIEGPGKQAPAMHFSNGGIMYMMKENVIESPKGHEIPQN